MRSNENFIDDMMALAKNAFGNLVGARQEFKAHASQYAEHIARSLDLVSRDEFDAAFAMLAKVRSVQEDIDDRLKIIERHLKLSRPPTGGTSAKARLPSVKKGKRKIK